MIICKDCGREKKHSAKGLCSTCYQRERYNSDQKFRKKYRKYHRRYDQEHRERRNKLRKAKSEEHKEHDTKESIRRLYKELDKYPYINKEAFICAGGALDKQLKQLAGE